MTTEDIRWEQRFNNYKRALEKLQQAVQQVSAPTERNGVLEDIIKEGLIQRFEYTHELAWNVMKDFLEHSGHTAIYGSKDATREAFQLGLITAGEVWMDMIKSRNKTSHTYNEETATEIVAIIMARYVDQFCAFRDKMDGLRSNSNKQ